MFAFARVHVLTAVCLLTSTAAGRAGLMTVMNTPTDLGGVHVGDTVTITVSLSGYGNTPVGYLAATVLFDASIWGTPFNVTPGSIVSDPLHSSPSRRLVRPTARTTFSFR